jgi:predicted outer membrane repeat protein
MEDRLTPVTIYVTTNADTVNFGDGRTSLREAIIGANATDEADVIKLGFGIYRIQLEGAGENGNATGDFDITKPLTIVGLGPNLTYIDAGRLDRAFDVIGDVDVNFSRLRIRNSGGSLNGGAIHSLTGDLTLNGCRFFDNTAWNGGAINTGSANVAMFNCWVMGNQATNGNGGGINSGTGSVTLTGSIVTNNSATGHGGGIRTNTATLSKSSVSLNSANESGGGIAATKVNLTDSTVKENFAQLGGGGVFADAAYLTASILSDNAAGYRGGGIWTETLILTASTISKNTAQVGGGIDAEGAFLSKSVLSGNHATSNGGGLFSVGTIVIESSTVRDNTGRFGGGIGHAQGYLRVSASTFYNNRAIETGGGLNISHGASAELTNVTISGNRADIAGGGLFCSSQESPLDTTETTSISLFHVTIARNISNDGGGIKNAEKTPGTFDLPAELTVRNSIIAHNYKPNDFLNGSTALESEIVGAFKSQGYNLFRVYDGSPFRLGSSDLVGTRRNPLDPRLGALASNGGPTLTHALLAGSKAIDAIEYYSIPPTDQRGRIRPSDGDGNGSRFADIGAFEK